MKRRFLNYLVVYTSVSLSVHYVVFVNKRKRRMGRCSLSGFRLTGRTKGDHLGDGGWKILYRFCLIFGLIFLSTKCGYQGLEGNLDFG